ncbi:hypothetical protein LFYK43_16460 [Ligilactobacillus salitolerans]|uniref:Phage tail tape measure protein domain-containing protein n=1 Tax=Ligilactobacillus salitolerans TaxID=1808352 RepID=A0A401IUM6_9LACO|nr:phage tail tape measure protein [Ligilactobacillus salitolerans]GBG95187.1 hypothetical protein LFYK43_16460 [Ligilactobacillus salitolerans]
MAHVQARMSTEIALNTLKASENLNHLKTVVQSTTRAWKAQETQMKSAGDYMGASERRVDGLRQSIKEQGTVVDNLKKKQEGLDVSTKSGANEFLKYQKQIDSATVQMRSMEGQLSRAEKQMQYQKSGLASLQSAYKLNNKAVEANVSRLKAEGKEASSTVAKYNGLQSSLKNLKSQYDIQERELKQVEQASGKTSDAYKKQKIRLDQTGKAMAEAKAQTKAMSGEFNKLQPTGIKRVDNAVVKVKDHTGKLGAAAKANFAKFKSAAITASIGVGILGSSMVKGAKQASELQNTYNENTNLLVTAGEKQKNVTKEIAQMQKDGRKYSVQYGESQHNIAKGYQELVKRGYDGEQSLGAMKSILQASKASGDDFSDTMQVTTSTLEAFGMRTNSTSGMMKNTAKVANSLAMAADATSTNFSDLGVGMSYVGTSAKQAGLSLEDTASAMGVLSNSGIEADKAGTGLRKTINSLMSPTKSGADALEQYGLSVDDFKTKSGKLKPIGTIFEEIGKKVPKGEQANFFHNVFGTTGQNAASVLAQNTSELKKVNDQVAGAYKNDYVGKLSTKNMKSAQNQIKQFKQAGNMILTTVGGEMLPAMSKFSKAMTKALTSKDGQAGLKAIAKGLGSIMKAIGNAVAFIGKHQKGVETFGKVMLVAFAGAKLFKGISTLVELLGGIPLALTAIGGPVTIAIAAITAIAGVAIVVKDNWKPISKFFSNLWKGIKKGASDAWKSIKKGVSGVWKSISKAFSPVAKGISKVWKSVTKGTSTAWKGIKEVVKIGATAVKVVALAPLVVLAATIVSIWKHIKKPTTEVWNWLKGFVGGIAKSVKTTVSKWFNALKNTITTIWNSIKKVTSAVWNPIKKFITGIAKSIKDTVTKWFHSLQNSVTGIWNAIKKNTSAIWNPIGKFLGSKSKSISHSVSKSFNGLKGSLSNIMGSISDKWHKTWNSMASFFGTVWTKIKGHAKDGIKGVVGWLNGGIGGINKVIHTFGGSKTAINPIKLAKGGTAKGLAMVNDGAGEEAIIKNGKAYKVKGKNALVNFDGDETVIPHEESRAMFGDAIKRYAKGSTGWFASLTGWVKDKWDGLKDFIKHPLKSLTGIMDKAMAKVSGSEIVTKLTPALGHGLITSISDAFGKLLKKLKSKHDKEEGDAGGAMGAPAGTGVKRWTATVKKALAANNLSTSDSMVNKVLRQIATESGGNNKAVQGNIGDINNLTGDLAKGLMQTISATFNAYKFAGHGNIFNGYDNLLAALNYAKHRYGKSLSFLGNGHGYANGGLINSHGMYEIGEGNKPEMVIPMDSMKSSRAMQLLSQVVAKLAHDNPQVGTETSLESVSHDDFKKLNDKFDTLLAMFGQLLGLNGAQLEAIRNGAFDKTKMYNQQAKDQSLADIQSIGGV